jgi:nucleotide-binding universal stress UspA family protein
VTIKTILNYLGDDDQSEARLRASSALAMRFQAELTALHVTPPMFVPVGLAEGTAFAGPEMQEAHAAVAARVTERLKDLFRRVCEPSQVPVHWLHVNGEPGSLVPVLARTADLTVAGVDAAIGIDVLAPSVAEQAALGAGGPVLLLPRGSFEGNLGRRVLIGWNGSKESARAAHDAVPFLVEAAEVVLVALGDAAGETLDGAARMLRRHRGQVETIREGEPAHVGRRLLELAGQRGADLLVMGAYGRARIRELILGGATREMLSSSTIPLLLSA